MKICDTIKNMFKHKIEPEQDEVIKSAEQLADILKEATGKDVPVFKIDLPSGHRNILPIDEGDENE